MVAIAEDTTIPLSLLHELCYDKRDDSVAFRAAWILEYIATHCPTRFTAVFSGFMARLSEQRNPSCQRHFTKILMLITSGKAPEPYRDAYAGIDREQAVETVFSWLIDPGTPVAVQVNCMDILFNMSGEFAWISEELKQQIDFFLRDGSHAVQSRGRKILDKLRKIRTEG